MLGLKMFMNQFPFRSEWRLSRSECFNGIELNRWADYYRCSECLASMNLIIIRNLISKCMKVALGNQGNLKSNFTSNRMCIVQTCLECYGQCHSSAFYQLISGASFMPWQRQPIECSSFIQLNDGMRTTVTFAIWWMLLWNSKHLHVRIPTEICEIVLLLSLFLYCSNSNRRDPSIHSIITYRKLSQWFANSNLKNRPTNCWFQKCASERSTGTCVCGSKLNNV